MTHSADHLSHVKNYDGDLTIHTANGVIYIHRIHSSGHKQIVFNLRPFKTAKGTWDHMKRVYNQENPAGRFQLENEKSKYTRRNK